MNFKLLLFIGSVFLSINGPLHASKDPIINRIQNMQKPATDAMKNFEIKIFFYLL